MTPTLEDVRALIRSESDGELRGAELIRRCTQLALALQPTNTPDDPVPHAVWHYLSDADIRTRDPKYAAAQLAQVTAALGGSEK